MLIDWFTIVAQIINFMVLVWLMKRFLYKPILRAIDEREKRIAAEIDAAEIARLEATEQRDQFRQKNEDFDRRFVEQLAEATAEVDRKRQQMLDEARSAAEAVTERWRIDLEAKASDFEQAFNMQIGDTVLTVTRKILQDLASVELESRIVAVMLDRLRLPVTIRDLSEHRSNDADLAVTLTSAFELPADDRNQIEQAVREALATHVRISFKTRADLVCGLELLMDGYKISWNIRDYLSSLQKIMAQSQAAAR